MAAKKRKKQRPQRVRTHTPYVPTAPVVHPVVLSEYEITDEPLENRHIKRLPAQVQARVDDLYELAQHDPTQAIPELERLIATYPHVPTFYNYLSIAYLAAGDQEKATACVREAYRRHPQYLFAKVNYANLCLSNSNFGDQLVSNCDSSSRPRIMKSIKWSQWSKTIYRMKACISWENVWRLASTWRSNGSLSQPRVRSN